MLCGVWAAGVPGAISGRPAGGGVTGLAQRHDHNRQPLTGRVALHVTSEIVTAFDLLPGCCESSIEPRHIFWVEAALPYDLPDDHAKYSPTRDMPPPFLKINLRVCCSSKAIVSALAKYSIEAK